MKITGIIVEYNPLHNGHLHHINETRKKSNCDLLIAVMSGNYVQRGEPAIVNKHIRTQWALNSGIDIVVELPYIYAVSSADIFAFGAIKILNELKVTDIYFGSETDNISLLSEIAKLIDTDEFNDEIKIHLDKGLAYPRACEITINNLANFTYQFNANDILGIQYIRNIYKINSLMNYHSIKRLHSNYNDIEISHESIASATSIRSELFKNNNVTNYVPNYTLTTLTHSKLTYWDDFFQYLKYQVNVNQNNLAYIYDIKEGLENNIIQNINKYNNFDEFVNFLVSRRYTKAKIKRVLTHILNNVTKDEVDLINGPKYIRILGINSNKSNILQTIKKMTNIPIITNVNKTNFDLIKLDERVSSVYHLVDLKQSRKIPIIREM